MKTVLISFLILLAHPTKKVPSSQVIEQLQKSWNGVKTLKAKFHQTVEAKQLGSKDESDGLVYLAKPDRMRWESPGEGLTQILNGNTFTVVRENLRRQTVDVQIYKNAGEALDSKVLRFLAGTEDFKSLYRWKLLAPVGLQPQIEFTPKGSKSEPPVVAEVDKKSYLFRALSTEAEDSRVRIELSDLVTNSELDSSLFVYVPKKTDRVQTH